MNKSKLSIKPRKSHDTTPVAGPYIGTITLNSGTPAAAFSLTGAGGAAVTLTNGQYDLDDNQQFTFNVYLGSGFTTNNLPTITIAKMTCSKVPSGNDPTATPFGDATPTFIITAGSSTTLPTAATGPLSMSKNGAWNVSANFTVTGGTPTPQTFTWDPEVVVGTGTNTRQPGG